MCESSLKMYDYNKYDGIQDHKRPISSWKSKTVCAKGRFNQNHDIRFVNCLLRNGVIYSVKAQNVNIFDVTYSYSQI